MVRSDEKRRTATKTAQEGLGTTRSLQQPWLLGRLTCEGTLKDLFVSVSQTGKFKECERAWTVSHVRKLQPRSEGSAAMLFGRAVHGALEQLHGPEGKPDRLGAALEALDVVFEEQQSMEVDVPGEAEPQKIGGVDRFERARARAM